MNKFQRISMLIYPEIQILDVTGPLEVFARTSRWLIDHQQAKSEAYRVELLASKAGPVTSSSGLQLIAKRNYLEANDIDTLLVAGGIGYLQVMQDIEIIDWLRIMKSQVKRLGSVCTGAMILARAGLLDERRATTHWGYANQLGEAGERIKLDTDSIYVRDENIYTSAGVTAGMDMALAMVAEDWGEQVALAVAQELVLFLKRPGGQAQFSRQLQAQQAESGRLKRLQLWMLENLDEDLTVASLAGRVAMSPRNFARRFRLEVDKTPAAYVNSIRFEAARRRLETTDLPIAQVARLSGFGTTESMRRAFVQHLGISPSDYQARFSTW